MKEFIDNNTGLRWIIFDYKTDPHNHNSTKLKELRKQLNSWKSPEIEEFICGEYPLGDMLNIVGVQNNNVFFNNSTYQAFAFDKDKLVGTAILTTDKHKYVFYDKEISDRLKINFIVVNPNYTSRGIGTRMISSINNNQREFCHSVKTKGTVAWVSPHNPASQKAFLKNKFKRFKKMDSKERYVFYSTNRNNRKNTEMEP